MKEYMPNPNRLADSANWMGDNANWLKIGNLQKQSFSHLQ
jgi:hypothetical protein